MSDEPTAKDLKFLAWVTEGARLFSTCARARYMAILVDRDGAVVGVGYNGGPKGFPHCEDGGCRRLSEGAGTAGDYGNCIAIHAEQNALLHSDYSLRRGGVTVYVNGVPCFGCAKLMANGGVGRLVYLMETLDHRPAQATVEFLEAARVQIVAVPPLALCG